MANPPRQLTDRRSVMLLRERERSSAREGGTERERVCCFNKQSAVLGLQNIRIIHCDGGFQAHNLSDHFKIAKWPNLYPEGQVESPLGYVDPKP